MLSLKLNAFFNQHRESILVGFFSLIVIFPLGFQILIYFPLDQSPDIQTYLALARWDFDQNEVRKYRIIVPLLSGLIDFLFQPLFDALTPWTFNGDFSLCMSFLVVNSIVMCLTSIFLFKICRWYVVDKIVCGLALLAFLTNRWTIESAGLPLVDSLYILTIVMGIYGMLSKNKNCIVLSILIGPWAKEAYIFMIPLLLLTGFPGRMKLSVGLVVSGCIVFGFRYFMDRYTGHPWSASLLKDLDAFQTIPQSLNRLFSVHGLYELFSAIGLWFVVPLSVFFFYFEEFTRKLSQHGWVLFLAYLPFVLLQALLSADLGRMFYLAIPQAIIAVAIGLDIWRAKLTA